MCTTWKFFSHINYEIQYVELLVEVDHKIKIGEKETELNYNWFVRRTEYKFHGFVEFLEFTKSNQFSDWAKDFKFSCLLN